MNVVPPTSTPSATPNLSAETIPPATSPNYAPPTRLPIEPVANHNPATNCVSNPNPEFTAHISDLSKVEFISPTIVASGNWLKNRSYLVITQDENRQTYEVPVYAPSDATLIGITYYLQPMQDPQGNWVDVPQYDVRFQVSCEVTYGFDHLWRLPELMASLAPRQPTTSTRDAEVSTHLSVKAGDLIGYTTGTIVAHTWDFYLSNTSKHNRFANQARYVNSGDLQKLLTADCPYGYFSEAMEAEYYARFGGRSGQDGPGTCDISPDRIGTIAGGWFKQRFEADAIPEGEVGWGMAIVEGADGEVQVNDERHTVRAQHGDRTYADPKTVTGEHCYQYNRQPIEYAYLKLLNDMELAAAFGAGECPAQMPNEYSVYYR